MTKITNAQVNPTSRQSGWSYVTFTQASNTASVNVTFPTAFAAPPKVIASALGYKTGAAPTSISDFTGSYGGGSTLPVPYITNITATGFTMTISAPPGTTFGASTNGFTWIAEA